VWPTEQVPSPVLAEQSVDDNSLASVRFESSASDADRAAAVVGDSARDPVQVVSRVDGWREVRRGQVAGEFPRRPMVRDRWTRRARARLTHQAAATSSATASCG